MVVLPPIREAKGDRDFGIEAVAAVNGAGVEAQPVTPVRAGLAGLETRPARAVGAGARRGDRSATPSHAETLETTATPAAGRPVARSRTWVVT